MCVCVCPLTVVPGGGLEQLLELAIFDVLARRLNAPLTLAQVWRYPDLCIYMYNIWVYTHKCT
jgi:hypothetical protein